MIWQRIQDYGIGRAVIVVLGACMAVLLAIGGALLVGALSWIMAAL